MQINRWSGDKATLKLASLEKKNQNTRLVYRIINQVAKKSSYINAIELNLDSDQKRYFIKVIYKLNACEAINEAFSDLKINFTHNIDQQTCSFCVSDKEIYSAIIQNILKCNDCDKRAKGALNLAFITPDLYSKL